MPYAPSLALVTGASSGLGAEIAKRLAARGSELVLVARRRELLAELAAELHEQHGVTVHVLAMDLGIPAAGPTLLAAVEQATGGRAVELVVNNAGFGLYGPLLGNDPERLEQMLALNVTALTSITRAFTPPMVQRGSGTLVNIASTGGFQPTPGLAAYAAAKAYVLHLSEALWREVGPSGVRVTAYCPGPVSTDFFDVAGSQHGPLGGRVATAAQVADVLLAALDRPRLGPYLVPDRFNHVQSLLARVLPRRLSIVVAGKLMKQP